MSKLIIPKIKLINNFKKIKESKDLIKKNFINYGIV